jgi:hypothetical protein
VDALLIGLIAALLAETGGTTQRATNGVSGISAAGVAVAMIATLAAAVAGGAYVASILTFHARALLLGIALLFAAAAQLMPAKDHNPARGRAFALGYAFIGGPVPFLAFAIAARSASPGLALAGTLAGSALVLAPVWLGLIPGQAAAWTRAIRLTAAILLGGAGFWSAASGLRLI